jgi:4-diphosphocytidyl-2-C-methyl-D-erythritol kinase
MLPWFFVFSDPKNKDKFYILIEYIRLSLLFYFFKLMIVFPNAKINIGLNIIEKRPDGFHNLESVFFPVMWHDALEILIDNEQPNGNIAFSSGGLDIPGDSNQNLCVKAYHLLRNEYDLPALKVHLHKNIPMGAGLGGGSSDAAFFIKALNEVCNVGLSWGEMHYYAKQLGSDCSFFISNKPAFATQKGDELELIDIKLTGKYIAIVHPGIHVSTAEAYAGVKSQKPQNSLKELLLHQPIEKWKELVVNDFEISVFAKFPAIKELKILLYNAGALYASMSGSGSAVYGIFNEKPELNLPNKNYAVFIAAG